MSSGGSGTLVESSVDAEGLVERRTSPEADVLATHPRFALRERLGSGTFGTVFEAFDRDLGAVVAIKALVGVSPSALYRFKHEFRSVANVHHENLVQLHELFSHRGTWFFSMERLRGLAFEAYVRGPAPTPTPGRRTPVDSAAATRDGTDSEESWHDAEEDPSVVGGHRLDLERLHAGLAQLVDGIRAIHAHGKLHRDIKDSNVMVEEDGRVVLLDFGLIAEESGGGEGEMVGTPLYMAPEQCIGERVGPACDFYALGVLLYRCLTGVFPFVGAPRSVMSRKLTDRPVHPNDHVPTAPRDLAELAMALLEPDPALRPDGEQVSARLRQTEDAIARPRQASDSGVFVGRTPELDLLLSAYQALTAGGRPRRVHIRGLSGLGKTRLARQFLASLPSSTLVLAGRCYEQETVPFKALDSVVDALCLHLRTLSGAALAELKPVGLASLRRVFPVLGRAWPKDRGSLGEAAELEPAAAARQAFAALRSLLGRLAEREGGLVIFVDDLQWGDLDSARGLEELLRAPQAPRFMLLSTHRTDEEQTSDCLLRLLRVPDEGEGLPGHQVIDLAPLAPEEVEELVRVRLGDRTIAAAVLDEARGNPLIVDQLTAFADEGAQVTSLAALTRTRVDRLSAAARGVLETVAIAGAPVRTRTAVRAAAGAGIGIAAAQTLAGVGQLRTLRLVRSAGTDDLLPYHDQIRQAVVEILEPERRRGLHLHLAQELELDSGVDPERLGDHFEAAGSLVRARDYLVRAGDDALGGLAFGKAVTLYRRVLGFDEVPNEQVIRIRTQLAAALESLGDGVGAGRVYARLAETAEPSAALAHRGSAARCFLRYGNVQEGLVLAKQVLHDLDVPLNLGPVAAGLSLGATRIKLRGRTLEVPERVDLIKSTRCEALRNLGPAMGSYHHSVVGADMAARALLLATEGGRPDQVASALVNESAFAAAVLQDDERAQTLLARARALAERLDDPVLTMHTHAGAGLVSLFLGRYDDAATGLLRAVEYGAQHCPWSHYLYIFSQRYALWALWASGRYRELSVLSDLWTGEHRRRGDTVGFVMLGMANQANIPLIENRAEDAAAVVEVIASTWHAERFGQLDWSSAYSGIEASLYAGAGDEALAALHSSWPSLRKTGLHRVAYYGTQRWYAEGTALLQLGDEQLPGRVRKLQRVVKRLSRGRLPEQGAKAAVIRAGLLAQRGQKEQAVAHLLDARRGFEAAQMHGHVDAVDVARARLGEDVPDALAALASRGAGDPASFARYLIPVA